MFLCMQRSSVGALKESSYFLYFPAQTGNLKFEIAFEWTIMKYMFSKPFHFKLVIPFFTSGRRVSHHSLWCQTNKTLHNFSPGRSTWASGKSTRKPKQFQRDQPPAASSAALNLFKMNSLGLPNRKHCVSLCFCLWVQETLNFFGLPWQILKPHQPFIDCPCNINWDVFFLNPAAAVRHH